MTLDKYMEDMIHRVEAGKTLEADIILIRQVFEAGFYLCKERDEYAAHNAELSREIEQLRKEIDSLKWKQPLF